MLDQAPRRAADPVHGLLADVHARGEQQIATALRLAKERDAARVEAAGLLRVNLELQRHLDEYNHHDRPAYEQRIADLEAEVERLRSADTLVLPKYVPTRRGGWRRSR